MAERSEAKRVKRSFASKYLEIRFLTRSFASRFQLRYAQPFLARFKWTTNWSLYPQGLKCQKRLVIFHYNFRTNLQELSEKTDISGDLANRFNEEREVEAIKRKEKNETHFFMTVNIISDEQFGGHQGSGLLDPDCVSFR